MTADVDLLPLPEEEWNVRYGYHADTVQDYASACVAHATAAKDAEIDALRTRLEDTVRDSTNEIEALRAEAAKRDGIDPWAVLLRAQEAEARAERMAEALTMAENVLSRYPFSASVWPNGMHPQEGITRIRAALNPTAAQKGKESFWPKLPGSGGPDWTGHD